jgi:hypothetical protein
MDELPAATQPPAIEQEGLIDRFPHADASEDDSLRHQQPRIVGKIDLDCALEPRAIEQDRLLRQPGERRVGAEAKLHVDARGGFKRAIDLLRRGRGDEEPGAGLRRNVEHEAVAACDAARGIDDNRLKLGRRRSGTTHAQRAASTRCSRGPPA